MDTDALLSSSLIWLQLGFGLAVAGAMTIAEKRLLEFCDGWIGAGGGGSHKIFLFFGWEPL